MGQCDLEPWFSIKFLRVGKVNRSQMFHICPGSPLAGLTLPVTSIFLFSLLIPYFMQWTSMKKKFPLAYSWNNPHPLMDGVVFNLPSHLDFFKHKTPLLPKFPRQKTPSSPLLLGFPRQKTPSPPSCLDFQDKRPPPTLQLEFPGKNIRLKLIKYVFNKKYTQSSLDDILL